MMRALAVLGLLLIVGGLVVGSYSRGDVTVRAASGDLGSVQDTWEFDGTACGYPYQIEISSGVVACVYTDNSDYGQLFTYPVHPDGTIGSQIDSLTFDSTRAREPKILNIVGTTKYVIVYQGTYPDGEMCTVDIQDDGTIGNTVVDSHVFDDTQGEVPWIFHVDGDVYGVCYKGPDNDGWLQTLDINSDGTIDADPKIDDWEWDTVGSGYQYMYHVSGTVYVCGYYSSSADHHYAFSFNIATNGTITESKTDTLDGGTGEKGGLWFGPVAGDVYAFTMAWDSGGLNDPTEYYPRLLTITVDSSGNISNSHVDTHYFESRARVSSVVGGTCFQASRDGDFVVCSVGYSATSPGRTIYTADVDSSGNIGSTQDSLSLGTTNGTHTGVISVYEDAIWSCVSTGPDSDGFVDTFDIDEGTGLAISCTPSSYGFGAVEASQTLPTGAYGHFDSVVDTLEIETTDFTARAASMCEVATGVVAVAYPPTLGSVVLKTFDVGSDGNLGSVLDSLTMWSTSPSRWPVLLQHPSDSTTFVVFGLCSQDPRVATATIDSAGNIDNAVVDYHDFGSPLLDSDWFLDACSVGGDTFALVCDGADGDGYLTTVDVNSDGSIDADPELDQWEFDAAYCKGPSIVHVTGTYYAVYYRDSLAYMKLFTTTIAANGTLSDSKTEELTVSTTDCDCGEIIEVGGGVFVMSSVGTGSVPLLETCTIDGSGDITLVDEQLLPSGAAEYGNLLSPGAGVVCFYRNGTSDGRAISYYIDSSGNFGAPMDWITWLGSQPDWMFHSVLSVSDTVCLVGYQGADDDGFVTSVGMDLGTIEDYFVLTSSGTVSSDVIIAGSDLTGGGETWTLSGTATPGASTYGMKAGLFGYKELDDYEWDPVKGAYVDSCAVATGVVAVAFQNTDGDGELCTFTVDANGVIGDVVDTLVFDSNELYRPRLLKYSGQNTYACFYEGTGADVLVETFTIDVDGDNITSVDAHTIADTGSRPDAVQRSGDTWAVVYRDGDGDGQIVTMDINSDGSIDASPGLDSWEFAPDKDVSYPRILQVSGDYCAILYTESGGGDLLLFTTTVETDGTLDEGFDDTLTVDSSYTGGSNLAFGLVRGDVYATAHQGDDNDGWMETFTISSVGAIGNSVVSQVEFETTYCSYSTLLGDGSDSVMVACVAHDGEYYGKIVEYAVDASGNVTYTGLAGRFDGDYCSYLGPLSMIETRTGIFTVVYSGAGEDGWVKSFEWDPGFDIVVKKSVCFNNLVNNVSAGDSVYFSLQMLTPTSGLLGNQVSGTVTLVCVQHT